MMKRKKLRVNQNEEKRDATCRKKYRNSCLGGEVVLTV
jgi:hypothetical protein